MPQQHMCMLTAYTRIARYLSVSLVASMITLLVLSFACRTSWERHRVKNDGWASPAPGKASRKACKMATKPADVPPALGKLPTPSQVI